MFTAHPSADDRCHYMSQRRFSVAGYFRADFTWSLDLHVEARQIFSQRRKIVSELVSLLVQLWQIKVSDWILGLLKSQFKIDFPLQASLICSRKSMSTLPKDCGEPGSLDSKGGDTEQHSILEIPYWSKGMWIVDIRLNWWVFNHISLFTSHFFNHI